MKKTYTTKSGDTWDHIAYKVYGDCKYMKELIEANQQHTNVFIFSDNITLVIPDLDKIKKMNALPPWRI